MSLYPGSTVHNGIEYHLLKMSLLALVTRKANCTPRENLNKVITLWNECLYHASNLRGRHRPHLMSFEESQPFCASHSSWTLERITTHVTATAAFHVIAFACRMSYTFLGPSKGNCFLEARVNLCFAAAARFVWKGAAYSLCTEKIQHLLCSHIKHCPLWYPMCNSTIFTWKIK